MALNHGKLMETLETLTQAPARESFIFDFLAAYQTPKATLSRVRQGGDRNVGEAEGDVGIRRKLYFRPLDTEADPFTEAKNLKNAPAIERHQIRFVVTTNFRDLVAYDLAIEDFLDCPFGDLHRYYSFFLPLAGYEKARTHTESVADVKAAERMGRLCDIIRKENAFDTPEDLHALNVFLTRLLFCLFAEDTGIFDKHQFTDTLRGNTRDDGSNTDTFLEHLFDVLNQENRPADCPAHFAAFPFVNGGLFRESLPVPAMGKRARRYLIEAGSLDWSAINPDIFGSMFQAVIDPQQRGSLGQHYTSVSNIMKVIRSLFLDKLEAELERSSGSRKRLKALLTRLQRIKVFDPACGSGNFLIIAYKELRRIEMEVFEAMEALSAKHQEPLIPDDQSEMFERPGQQKLMVQGGQREIFMSGIQLSQFYGIEIDDFAHETAMLALWLAEHQMNLAFKDRFGYTEPSLPLRSSGNIVHGNALRVHWENICSGDDEGEVYLCGNPPFLGSKGTNSKSDSHREDMEIVFEGVSGWKSLDYVASWFYKGSQYVDKARVDASMAFLSTSSVFQGEQVAVLWPEMAKYGVSIIYAYQSFPWSNSAKNKAGVHVSVVGVGRGKEHTRRIFRKLDNHWHGEVVERISPYLVPGDERAVQRRMSPFLGARKMVDGNNYTKSEALILNDEEKMELIKGDPESEKWIRPLIGADEFLNGKNRWCLWLQGATDAEISRMPLVKKRIDSVRKDRLASKKKSTREVASRTPHLFAEIRQPEEGRYIVVPRVTSERREYAPVGFVECSVISTNQNLIIPNGKLYEFAMLCSMMHMDWLRLVGGRLKSDYRYSGTLVYNTFPWPEAKNEQRQAIKALAKEILLVREEYFDWTMAEMYDPDQMPSRLREAHAALDRAVEKLYRDKPFRDMAERQEYLLARYQELVRAEQAEQQATRASQGA